MKTKAKKIFLFEAKKLCFLAVFALFIAGGVFAQRVGDVIIVSGQSWRVQELRDGIMMLQLIPSLNGVWVMEDEVISINGSNGIFTQMPSTSLVRDAVSKGFINIGDQRYRNLTRTGEFTWTGQMNGFMAHDTTPNIAIGISWRNVTIIMSPNGQSFEAHSPDGISTYIRRW